LRRFLGLCTYYRRFVAGYANIAKPLTQLTEEKRQSRRPCPDGCKHCLKVEEQDGAHAVGAIAAQPSPGWDNAAIRREQLEDPNIGQLLRDVESGQRPVWADIANPDGRTRIEQLVLPKSKVKEVLKETHAGVTGGHLGANKRGEGSGFFCSAISRDAWNFRGYVAVVINYGREGTTAVFIIVEVVHRTSSESESDSYTLLVSLDVGSTRRRTTAKTAHDNQNAWYRIKRQVNKETGCSSINGTSTNDGPVKRKLQGRRKTTVPVSDYESDEIELDTDYDVSGVLSIFTDSESDMEKKTKSVKLMLKAHSYMVVTYEEELWPGKVFEVLELLFHVYSDLGWGEHVTDTAGKAWRALHFVMRVVRKGSDKSKEIAYKSLVRPAMEYGAACWDPYRLEHIKTLEKIKKRALKCCRKNSPLKWDTLTDRRTRIRLCALFKTYRGEPAWREIKNRLQPPNYSSRNDHSYKLRERRQRTDTGKFSFLNRTIRDWNALPADLLNALPTTKNVFKNRLKDLTNRR
ncbi:hypothetical protein ANN_03220, partial [Periplaneta americana]